VLARRLSWETQTNLLVFVALALMWRNLPHEYHVGTELVSRSDLIAVVPTGSVRRRLNLDRQTSTYLPWHRLLGKNGSLTILDPEQAFQ